MKTKSKIEKNLNQGVARPAVVTIAVAQPRSLTDRETEVLRLICNELTPGEISEQLSISPKTFFNHRKNILKKTGSRTNVGLMKYAVSRRLKGIHIFVGN